MRHACTCNPNRSREHEKKRELTAMEFGMSRGRYCMSSGQVFYDATVLDDCCITGNLARWHAIFVSRTHSAESANSGFVPATTNASGQVRPLRRWRSLLPASITGICRNKGVYRPTHHCELRIVAGRWHLTRSRRSVRRRGNLDPVSKGKRLMQKTLLRQREVRMMSSKGMDLRST